MSKTLVVYVKFSDDSDLDYFRARIVDTVDDVVDIIVNGRDDEPARADGIIQVDWDIEE